MLIDFYRPPSTTAEERQAWLLYCQDTAGSMHVADHWWELPEYVKQRFLDKVRKEKI